MFQKIVQRGIFRYVISSGNLSNALRVDHVTISTLQIDQGKFDKKIAAKRFRILLNKRRVQHKLQKNNLKSPEKPQLTKF